MHSEWPSDNQTTLTLDELESAFTGTIDPASISWAYRAALLIVAIAVVVLPFCYIGIIALGGWILKWHLTSKAWLLTQPDRSMWGTFAYVGPAAAGLIILFFLFKPLFARPARYVEPVILDAENEPVLFAFIAGICDRVRAPRPARVLADCNPNASASLQNHLKGLLAFRPDLTIGLPLVAALNGQQFAGIIAHELGHFAQGTGMRITFVIRAVNRWFVRVIYERDEWDERLEQWSLKAPGLLDLVLLLALIGVWISRLLLYGLMLVGHGISCFMLRQMEFDADYYEAALSGSTSFAVTVRRLRELELATQECYRDISRTGRSGRLPANLPALVVARAAALPAGAREAIDESQEQSRRRFFDTHPADADRIDRAAAIGADGVLVLDCAAQRLFFDFDGLAHQVTQHHYTNDLRFQLEAFQLVDSAVLASEGSTAAAARHAGHAFFGHVLLASRPVTLSDTGPLLSTADAIARLIDVRNAVRDRAAEAQEAAVRFAAAEERSDTASDALALLDIGLSVDPRAFGLEKGNRDEVVEVIENAVAAQHSEIPVLEAFEQLQRERLELDLVLVAGKISSGSTLSPPERVAEAERLCVSLRAVVAASTIAHEARRRLRSWQLLSAHRQRHHLDDAFLRALRREEIAEGRVRDSLTGLANALACVRYPFPHAQPDASIATYLTAECGWPDGGKELSMADAMLDRYWALYYGLLGSLAAIALQVEEAVLPSMTDETASMQASDTSL